MSYNQVNSYNVEAHMAEIYDQLVTDTDDVDLIFHFIGDRQSLHIFEPFCGTGRILIPLAQAAHQLTGLDQSAVLLDRCREKLAVANLQATLIEGDVIKDPWPGGFDLIVMGGNCLYELATPEEQERCIRSAASALKPGGYLYLDNDHMEGLLSPIWQDTSVSRGFLSGVCSDGVRLESTMQTIWFDAPARLARFQRTVQAISPDGTVTEQSFIQQKHPVSAGEVTGWLKKYGFVIEANYGSRSRDSYTPESSRAIFWARKVG